LNFFFFSYLLLWVSQIIFVTMKKLLSLLSLIFRHFWRLIVVFYPISFSEKPDFKILKNYLFVSISLFGFQWSFFRLTLLLFAFWVAVGTADLVGSNIESLSALSSLYVV